MRRLRFVLAAAVLFAQIQPALSMELFSNVRRVRLEKSGAVERFKKLDLATQIAAIELAQSHVDLEILDLSRIPGIQEKMTAAAGASLPGTPEQMAAILVHDIVTNCDATRQLAKFLREHVKKSAPGFSDSQTLTAYAGELNALFDRSEGHEGMDDGLPPIGELSDKALTLLNPHQLGFPQRLERFQSLQYSHEPHDMEHVLRYLLHRTAQESRSDFLPVALEFFVGLDREKTQFEIDAPHLLRRLPPEQNVLRKRMENILGVAPQSSKLLPLETGVENWKIPKLLLPIFVALGACLWLAALAMKWILGMKEFPTPLPPETGELPVRQAGFWAEVLDVIAASFLVAGVYYWAKISIENDSPLTFDQLKAMAQYVLFPYGAIKLSRQMNLLTGTNSGGDMFEVLWGLVPNVLLPILALCLVPPIAWILFRNFPAHLEITAGVGLMVLLTWAARRFSTGVVDRYLMKSKK